MRIYVFEFGGVHFFIVASTEEQARAIIGTHCSPSAAKMATYVRCGMSFTATALGNGEPYVNVEDL